MGNVTHIDFNAGRQAKAAPRAHDFGWADQVAGWWYSPVGRWVACALTLGVIGAGLGILVVALLLLVTP